MSRLMDTLFNSYDIENRKNDDLTIMNVLAS